MTIYWCIKCKSEFKNSRESLMDGMNCPACRGCLLPKHEYLEIKKYKCDEVEKVNPSLLTIELESETAVPKVTYKGEELGAKIKVFFDWETKKSEKFGGVNIHIEHAPKASRPTANIIGLKTGDFAFNE